MMFIRTLNLATILVIIQTSVVLGFVRHQGFDVECPDKINSFILCPRQFPFGTENRDVKTAPPGIVIKESTIKEAGRGAFSQTFISRYTWLGEYEGVIIPEDKVTDESDDTYMWRVYQHNKISYFIDGISELSSNWLRYVNCARSPQEQNVDFHYCYGKVYYITTKPVAPGQELLIYYGDDYASRLNIDTDLFY